MTAPGKSGFANATIGDELEAVQITGRLWREIDRLTDAGVPPEQWPAEILNPVMGLVQFYEKMEE